MKNSIKRKNIMKQECSFKKGQDKSVGVYRYLHDISLSN